MKFSLPPCRYQQHQYERALISPTRKCLVDEPPTKNASLIPQIILHYHPAGVARIKSISSHQLISPSQPPSDYSPSTSPSPAPINVAPLAQQQPRAQANCSSAPATSPIHDEIPQHHQRFLTQLLNQRPHPLGVAQASWTPAASARDRTERRLRGTAGCSGLLAL
jgi:hypothetical protein